MADFLDGFPDCMVLLARSSKYIFVQKCLPKLYNQVSGGEHKTLFYFIEKDVRN